MEGLVLARAMKLCYGGLLYAEPPNLWFVEIDGDQPGKKTLVDSEYVTGGNVEHQPNGLDLNIDNWIYSAKSVFRYRLKDGNWLKEKTTFRGQWESLMIMKVAFSIMIIQTHYMEILYWQIN